MAKYNVKWVCGHEGKVDIFGPHKDREWKLEREHEKMCPECYEKYLREEKARLNAEAKAANELAGLPALEGSEKQTAWAETIRKTMLGIIEKMIAKERIGDTLYREWQYSPEEIRAGFESLKKQVSASWWIENRADQPSPLYHIMKAEIERVKTIVVAPAEVVAEAKAEATVYPEEARVDVVTEIRIDNNYIVLNLPLKSEAFRELVKGLGYFWCYEESAWAREITSLRGPIEDRVAEIGNKLLLAGFPIRIYDENLRNRAINADYSNEITRWILVYENRLAILWRGMDHDLYEMARRIKGSRYDKPYVTLPAENFQEVLDFAEMYQFEITDEAKSLIEEAKVLRLQAITKVKPAPKAEEFPEASTKPQKLEVEEGAIDESLRDDD